MSRSSDSEVSPIWSDEDEMSAQNGALPLPNTTAAPEAAGAHHHQPKQSFVQRLISGPRSQQAKFKRPKDKERIKKLVLSYLFDWVVTIVLFGLFAGLANKGGFKREFSLTDTSLQHTYAVEERIPFWAAIVIGGVFPVVVIAVVGGLWRHSIYDVHSGLLGLLLSLALTTSATEIIKSTVGRPRPDVIDRCQPQQGAQNGVPYGLVTAAICTRMGHIIDDGFKSFPSGHSSFSFAGLFYLSLYLAGKVHLYDKKGHTLKAWLVWIPNIAAALVAISRTEDYRHHATDVIAGSLLGIFIAWFTYRLYYPSLHSTQCHLPYSPRIPRTGSDDVPLDAAPPGTVERPVNQHEYQRMKDPNALDGSYRYVTRSSEDAV